MASLQQTEGSLLYSRIISSWVGQLQNGWVCGASQWKHADQSHSPTVNGRETIARSRYFTLVQPLPKRRNRRIRMSQNEDWFLSFTAL
jgi:hypothetical protein